MKLIIRYYKKELYNYVFTFRDPLFSTTFGMIVRKNFVHTEMINIEIMWHYAFGLSKVSHKFQRNDGISAQKRAACADIVPPATCKLSPEADRDFVTDQA